MDDQGCQIGMFSNQKSQFGLFFGDLGIFWRILHWKTLVYFMAIRSISRPFGTHYDHHMVIWYISPRFGIWYQDKSGNPEDE
jgi:hypothetical protein